MSSLQSRIPLLSLLPKTWVIIVVNLKGSFFVIPLQQRDSEKNAFILSTYYNAKPVEMI